VVGWYGSKHLSQATDEIGLDVLRADMANYRPDGSATCAFVMPAPSTAGGRTSQTRSPTTRTGTSRSGCASATGTASHWTEPLTSRPGTTPGSQENR
jgi:hypothetical protein